MKSCSAARGENENLKRPARDAQGNARASSGRFNFSSSRNFAGLNGEESLEHFVGKKPALRRQTDYVS